MEVHNGKSTALEQVAPVDHDTGDPTSGSISSPHAQPETTGLETADEIEGSNQGWFAYLRTRNFYIVLLLGSVVSIRLQDIDCRQLY